MCGVSLHLNDGTLDLISTLLRPPGTISYLLIGLRNKTGNAAVSVQEVLKLLLTDDEPLRLSQGFLSRILTIDQQTLEHLNTGSTGEHRDGRVHKHAVAPSLPSPSNELGRAR